MTVMHASYGSIEPVHAPFRRPRRRLLFLLSLVAILWLFFWTTFVWSVDHIPAEHSKKVAVTAFVMSKCPDAVFCESHLAQVFDRVGDLVDFKTEYIAKPNASLDYGAKCLHGDSECLGNIVQLCVQKYHPSRDEWFKFVLCQNRKYGEIPSEKQSIICAREAGFDFKATDVQGCIYGEEGKKLLQTSLTSTIESEVIKSCTIFLNGKLRCIRDGRRWYNCPGGYSVDSFVESICALRGTTRSWFGLARSMWKGQPKCLNYNRVPTLVDNIDVDVDVN
ncbi:hypothetical protein BC829DRAFT_373785 [Chytridium lagenaria]|nr:hypothetical protein BC829DRAFT_373785 [Chytridium lagenaria]